jgi:hypothetical protein
MWLLVFQNSCYHTNKAHCIVVFFVELFFANVVVASLKIELKPLQLVSNGKFYVG